MTPARVWLVGTGPGQPGLLARQAAAVIADADVIRHIEECDAGILRLAPQNADIAPFAGADEVVKLAQAGKQVVVLYPGDPYAFGSGALLAEHLAHLRVDFEVIPGILLETAAAALSGVPLTVEGRTASIMLGVGSGDSVAVRLAPGWWESGVQALLEAGHSPDAQAVIIARPGGSDQRRVLAPLKEVVEVAKKAGLDGQAVLVLGPGVAFDDRLDTSSRRSLHGRRVLITRARHEVEPLRKELSRLGATVLEAPTIEIRALPVGARFRTAVDRLAMTDLVLFTTANAVATFFTQLYSTGHDARQLHNSRVCAVGAETARALELRGIKPDLFADDYSAESLSQVLQDSGLGRASVLVPRAEGARDALMGLLVRGGFKVELLPVYRAVRPVGCLRQIMGLVSDGGIDVVTFTSSITAINFVSAFPAGDLPAGLEQTLVACMGPVTADTVRRLGLRVDIVAREYTTLGLAAAVGEALG